MTRHMACVSGSLSDEQKAQLLHRFKVLCLTGLHAEAKQTNGSSEATLIRCNCCYNLPVRSGASGAAAHLGSSGHQVMFFSIRPCCSFLTRRTS